jgi:hypothetical protein
MSTCGTTQGMVSCAPLASGAAAAATELMRLVCVYGVELCVSECVCTLLTLSSGRMVCCFEYGSDFGTVRLVVSRLSPARNMHALNTTCVCLFLSKSHIFHDTIPLVSDVITFGAGGAIIHPWFS